MVHFRKICGCDNGGRFCNEAQRGRNSRGHVGQGLGLGRRIQLFRGGVDGVEVAKRGTDVVDDDGVVFGDGGNDAGAERRDLFLESREQKDQF